MADIAVTADNVRPTHVQNSEIFGGVRGEAMTLGQPVYMASTGKFMVADANAAGKQQVRGIVVALNGTAGISVLKRGPLAGYTLSGMAYDAVAYLSDTVGSLGTAAGTMSVPVGRVMAIPDDGLGGAPSKVLYVDCDWITTWA